jgi:hypothetical protein
MSKHTINAKENLPITNKAQLVGSYGTNKKGMNSNKILNLYTIIDKTGKIENYFEVLNERELYHKCNDIFEAIEKYNELN